MQECLQIKPKDWKQFRVRAPKGLKTGEIYKVDFNVNSFPRGVIPLQCTFIAGAHQKSIHVNLINQRDETVLILRGQHIGFIISMERCQPSQEEAHKILHRFKDSEHQVNKMKAGSINDFITSDEETLHPAEKTSQIQDQRKGVT